MLSMMSLLKERYGGTAQYLTECCGLGDEDLSRIQAILTESVVCPSETVERQERFH
jgi:hypothetical protein